MFLLSFCIVFLCVTAAVNALAFGRRDEVPPTELRYQEALGRREEISFPCGKNTLRGWLYPDGAEPRGLVLVAPGLGSGADTHLAAISRFLEEGYAVLCYDGTGTRRSDGSGVGGLPQSVQDLEAALRYVWQREELRALPLLLYGHSAGAYAAAVALPAHPEIAAAVCLAPFDSPLEEMLFHARQRAGEIVSLGEPFLRLVLRLRFGPGWNASAAEALSACDTPVLIAAGTEDTVVPLPVSLYIRRGAIEDPAAQYLLLPGGHSDFYLSAEARQNRAAALQGEPVAAESCNMLSESLMNAVLALFAEAAERGSAAA